MTITASTNRIAYAGDGTSTGFAFPFRIFAATDLEVFLGDVLQTTGYSVTGGDPSGTVNFAAAPGAGVAVLIRRAVPATQPMDLVANDPFPAETAEAAFDRNTILAIQMAELIQTCLRLPRSEALVGEMAAAAARANKYLGFDTSGAATLVSSQPLGPGEKEAYWWGGQAGGTAAAQTITVIDPPTAYQDGQRFNFLAVAASTGATTLKVNGLAALPIRKAGGGTALAAADIPAAGALVAVTVADGGTTVRINNVVPAVDLAAYAAKAAANSFTEPQTVEKAATGDLLTIRSTDAGAAAMGIKLDRNSASPAAADSLGDVQIAGRDDAATARVFSILRGILRDPAAATAEGEFQILQLLAGSLTTALAIRNGLVVGGATGGFQGTGTVNGAGFYRNGAALPVQRAYDSGLQTITSGGLLTLAHGLAAVPAFVTADLECQTIDAGYAVGEVLAIGPFYDSGGAAGMSVRKDATNLLVRFTSTGTVFATVQAGGGTGTFLTNANWKLRVRAYV